MAKNIKKTKPKKPVNGSLKYQSIRYFLDRFWREYIKQHKARLFIAGVCMIIVAATLAIQVQLVEPVISKVLGGAGMDVVALVALAFFVLGLIKGVANYLHTVFLSHISLLITRKLQMDVYNSLLSSDVESLEIEGSARQLARFGSDIGGMKNFIISFSIGIVKESLTVISLFGVMFYNSVQMTLAAIIVLPLTVWPVLTLGKKLKRLALQSQIQAGEVVSSLDDNLKGLRQIKSYNLFDYASKAVERTFTTAFNIAYKALRTGSLAGPLIDLSAAVVVSSVLLWGGYQINQGQINSGQFMAFFIALTTVYRPIRSLASLNIVMSVGVASSKRVFEVIDRIPEIRDKKNAKPLKFSSGRIDFKNVGFDYKIKKNILSNLNINVPAKKSVALVGLSGGGKSTIINLMPRFFDVNKGSIEIDGQDIKDITIESLRKNVGLVTQETILFNTTIRENIAIGDLDADEDAIIDAAKKSACWDFIKKLDKGLDTMVGERGLLLSGGQRQRIAIARAFLKDAPILLLDEATSSLDTLAERHIQKTLKGLMKDRTTITIAHRLSTIKEVDKIYVIDEGTVIESGTHTELKNKGGVYSTLLHSQDIN